MDTILSILFAPVLFVCLTVLTLVVIASWWLALCLVMWVVKELRRYMWGEDDD